MKELSNDRYEVITYNKSTHRYHKEIRNRVIEEKNGYRIYDDGRCETYHLFSIEKAIKDKKGKVVGWSAINKEIYLDWKEVHDIFETLANRVGKIDPFSGLIFS